LDSGVAATADSGGKHGIILQIVWAAIDVATIIGCHAARGLGATNQINADADVRENGVTENGVVDVRVEGCDLYSAGESTVAPSRTVEGDDVALPSARAANGVVVAGVAAVIRHINGEVVIAQRLSACDIRADNVALDKIARRAGHQHTSPAIGRDQIPRRRAGRSCQSADDIVACIRDRDAVSPIP
jgi:hypothetical protein